jgi:hypothetical protein
MTPSSGAKPPSTFGARTQRFLRVKAREAVRVMKGALKADYLPRNSVGPEMDLLFCRSFASLQKAFPENMAGVPIRSLDGMLDSLLHVMVFGGGSLQEARGLLCEACFGMNVMALSLFKSRHAFMAFCRLASVPACDPAPFKCKVFVARAVLRPGTCMALEVAAAILLHMVIYAWPAALLRLRRDLCIPPVMNLGALCPYWAIVFCPSMKMGRSKTFCQVVTVEVGLLGSRGYMNDALKAFVDSTPEVGCLFCVEVHAYLLMVSAASAKNGLSVMNIVPHLFRHTGQSLDGLYNVDLRIVQMRGMSMARSSVGRYSKHGRFLRQLNKLSSAQWAASLSDLAWLHFELPAALRGRLGRVLPAHPPVQAPASPGPIWEIGGLEFVFC